MFKNFHPCSISRNAAARTRFRKRPEFGTSGSFLRDAMRFILAQRLWPYMLGRSGRIDTRADKRRRAAYADTLLQSLV